MPTADSYDASASLRANAPITVAAAPSRFAQDAVMALTSGRLDPSSANTVDPNSLAASQLSFLGIIQAPLPLESTPTKTGSGPDNNKNDNQKPDGGPKGPDQSNSSPSNPVKIATPDLINAFSLQKYNDVPIDSMSDIIFEDLGGQELLSVSRTDLINGQNINYQPISNLGSISIENSPSNIIKLQSTSKAYFDSFPIVLENYVPFVGSGSNGEIVYMDTTSGENIIIGVVNMTSDKLVQLEFISYGNMINDIIYP